MWNVHVCDVRLLGCLKMDFDVVVVVVFIYRVQKLAINQRNENTLTEKATR